MTSQPARTRGVKVDPAHRDEFILQYAPLVKYVVGRMAISLPGVLSTEDLLSYGTIGLIQAVDRFDPTVGVKFETYAIQRIRGSVIDAIRSLQPLSRAATRRAREVEQAYDVLMERLARTPEDWEVADELGVSLEEFHRILVESSATVVSLDLPLGNMGDDGSEHSSLANEIPDAGAEGLADLAERAELLRSVSRAIEALGERERLVISLYYFDELTLREISEVLGVSTSRVSQIHAAAVFKLRSTLRVSSFEFRVSSSGASTCSQE
jgi:RNA polymerase sigma factor for flagellar operon FliA